MSSQPNVQGHMDTVVELRSVSKAFEGSTNPAVEALSFSLTKGEIMAILGPSGCGKTTTLRLIAGFESPDQGELLIRGREVSSKRTLAPPETRGVGMVFQDYALFPHLNVAKNIGFGLRKMKSLPLRNRVEEILDLIDMKSLANRYPHEISGGQQQRVALGRALAPRPVVVLMDEPFSNLDASMRGQMRREVQGIIRHEQATAILVTHDQQEALSFADKIAVMDQGRIEQLGSPEEIFHSPATAFVASFVGHASFLKGNIYGKEVVTEIGRFPLTSNCDQSEVIVMMRPDDINITPDESGQGTIESREFHGSRNFYFIKLDSGTTIRSRQPSAKIYPSGVRVKVESTSSSGLTVFPPSQQGLVPKDLPVNSPDRYSGQTTK